jgi:hypothetical protein
MSIGFEDYLGILKQRMDDAFGKALSTLLENAPMENTASLMEILQAGKKIRGCLSCMVSEALGGTLEAAIPRAVAVELIQAATLIHDDFVDQDTLRRNKPAAWTLEGARRAVLIGDVIFATAIKMMNDLGWEDGLAVSHAIAQVAKGALHEPLAPLDVIREIESHSLDGQWYDKIIHLKTGILFGTACRLGAIAANADVGTREISYRYGLRIGEAYQIADDMKEMNHHLLTRSIRPGQLAPLVPAFLHFADGMGPHILKVLRGESPEVDDPVWEFFGRAVMLMEKAIEDRLKSAVSEIQEDFATGQYRKLVRKAPWDLIRLFNLS